MIRKICDLCTTETDILDSIVLHGTCFDCCPRCRHLIREIIKIDTEIYKEEYKVFKKKLKEREEKLLKRFSSSRT